MPFWGLLILRANLASTEKSATGKVGLYLGGTDVLYQLGLRKQLYLQWILFSLVVGYLWSSLQYDLLTKCYSKWHSVCYIKLCVKYFYIVYIFFISINHNVKHVIVLIAQINYDLLILSLSLVRHFFNNVVSLVL